MLSSTKKNSFGLFTQLKKEFNNVAFYVKGDSIIYVLIAFIVAFVCLFASFNDCANKISLFSYMYAMKWVVFFSTLFLFFGYFFILLLRREPRPLLCYWDKLKLIYTHRARIVSAFILLTAISTFISSFSTMKGLIPLVHPFEYDLIFHDIDFWLFLGHEPWRVIHSIFNSPYLTLIINFFYNVWFFLIWGVLSYFLLALPSRSRTRYLISWLLCWSILGMIIAMLLSSAGPAFVGRLDIKNHYYDPLMQLLQEQNVWLKHRGWGEVFSLGTQDDLWQAYANGKYMLGSGISAMPSLHISMAVLMALGISSLNRKLGFAFWIFAGIIMIGSVDLGWHYVVDGLVSAPLTWLIWYLSGKVMRQ